jgi:hypothetical protein
MDWSEVALAMLFDFLFLTVGFIWGAKTRKRLGRRGGYQYGYVCEDDGCGFVFSSNQPTVTATIAESHRRFHRQGTHA